MTLSTQTARLGGLDYLRGLAALWVMFHHIDVTIMKPKYFNFDTGFLVAQVGYHGVDLFFLLSGFVMEYSYAGYARSAKQGVCEFATRRLFRVFPLYFVVFLPMFVVAIFTGIGAPQSVPMDGALFLSNLFLLPRDDLTTYIPVVSWTLTHELMFYILFSITFVFRKLFLSVLAIWAAACIAMSVFDFRVPGFEMMFSGLNAYFLVGVLCAKLHNTGKFHSYGILPLVFVPLLSLAIFMEGQQGDFGTFLKYATSTTYAAAFFGVVLYFSSGRVTMGSHFDCILAYFGKLSYGIYLVHYPIIVISTIILVKFGLHAGMAFPVLSLAALAVTVLAADVLHRLVEAPGIALGKRLIRRSSVATYA